MPGTITVPADWIQYTAPGDAFSFFHPADWTLASESSTDVAFTGTLTETFEIMFDPTACGVGLDDLPSEAILDCLATVGRQSFNGQLLSQELVIEQGVLLYTYVFAGFDPTQIASVRGYLLVESVAKDQMVAAFFQAPVLGPRKQQDLQMVMASIRLGKPVLQRVTPTLQSTPTDLPGLEPTITVAPKATPLPAAVPQDWIQDICKGCGLTYYHPSYWQLLNEASDHQLWRSQGTGLVVVGVGLAPCKIVGVDPKDALACLVQARTGQTDPNSEFIPLNSGYSNYTSGTIFFLAYRSSTPSDNRPLFGVAFYRLLEDHRMVTVEYVNVGAPPEPSELGDLYMVAGAVRLSAGLRYTPTPSAVPTKTPNAAPSPTINWDEQPLPVVNK
ncbi:MAG: hypothetical protein ACYC6L_03510 [Anaerolineae bacterium]